MTGYDKVQKALQKIAADNLRASADMIDRTAGFVSERPNHFDEAAAAARAVMANPMVVGALAGLLLGEIEE